ncbi:AzlC family ABC transporter permease [Aneurinibacillus sp. Ricciae_BoGa-3]|uniref:AzlC family ABC transporter permease n=1 Tax=Aneurinibacillus sp. Ricciae_BoGa-3 TaxID=3022697 RepID=UPI002340E4F5|nr:AzlC family ABC transporter permease [Aneurinibacillus sp. Ricciae_BoGa-3]WCK56403.1 AzlC family ABC transporter permease [Aneurinibacillus sp. Ricciae_BoGa-3]
MARKEVLTISDLSNKKYEFINGARGMLPIAMSGILDALVFGLLARQAGLSVTETVLFSILVNAGSSQFAALGLFSQGIFGVPVLLSTFLLNARHILYGLSLGTAFRTIPTWKLMSVALLLNDETYALKSKYLEEGKKTSLTYFFGAGLLDSGIWIGSTFVGAIFGTFISHPERYGLDFAYTATFLGFLAVNLKSSFYIKVAVGSAVAACLGYALNGPSLSVILGTACAIVLGVLFHER